MGADLERMRAQVRGWLAANAGVPVPELPVDPQPCPVGTVADLPQRPGPQPENGGITPGYKPPRPPGDPATVADLKALAAGVRAVLAEFGPRLDLIEAALKAVRGEAWELANWIARVEREHGSQTVDVAHGDRGASQGPAAERDDQRERAGGERRAG